MLTDPTIVAILTLCVKGKCLSRFLLIMDLMAFKSSSSVEFALHASVTSARRSGMSDSDVVFVLTSSVRPRNVLRKAASSSSSTHSCTVQVLRGHNAKATE